MKQLFFFIAMLLFSLSCISAEKLNDVFCSLEHELAQNNGDENGIIEYLRRQNNDNYDTHAASALAHILNNSEGLNKLRENLSLVLAKTPENLDAAAARIFVAVISSQESLKFIVPALGKYEYYIEKFGSKELAQNKALSFLCLYIINPMLFNAGEISLAKYIQKEASAFKSNKESNAKGAYQQVLSSFSYLDNKFTDPALHKNPPVIKL